MFKIKSTKNLIFNDCDFLIKKFLFKSKKKILYKLFLFKNNLYNIYYKNTKNLKNFKKLDLLFKKSVESNNKNKVLNFNFYKNFFILNNKERVMNFYIHYNYLLNFFKLNYLAQNSSIKVLFLSKNNCFLKKGCIKKLKFFYTNNDWNKKFYFYNLLVNSKKNYKRMLSKNRSMLLKHKDYIINYLKKSRNLKKKVSNKRYKNKCKGENQVILNLFDEVFSGKKNDKKKMIVKVKKKIVEEKEKIKLKFNILNHYLLNNDLKYKIFEKNKLFLNIKKNNNYRSMIKVGALPISYYYIKNNLITKKFIYFQNLKIDFNNFFYNYSTINNYKKNKNNFKKLKKKKKIINFFKKRINKCSKIFKNWYNKELFKKKKRVYAKVQKRRKFKKRLF